MNIFNNNKGAGDIITTDIHGKVADDADIVGDGHIDVKGAVVSNKIAFTGDDEDEYRQKMDKIGGVVARWCRRRRYKMTGQQ